MLEVSERVYSARLVATNMPKSMPAGSLRQVYVEIANEGNWAWRRLAPPGPSVDLAVRVDGELVTTIPLSVETVEPGGHATFTFKWRAPTEARAYVFEFDLVEQNVAFFESMQGPMYRLDLELEPHAKSDSERCFEIAERRNYWFYLPTEGVHWSAFGGSYPNFVRDAAGSKFHDLDGVEFIDYVMGWGSCLLGYAHPKIQSAVAEALGSSPLATLSYGDELMLSEKLAARFPGEQMCAFGKNGSDVTTVAVRLARASTGKERVLFCGYHGWQDWNTKLGPAPIASESFRNGDLAGLDRLLQQHDGDIAAIMIEAAGQVEGVDGPIRKADAAFLAAIRERCDARGIVLIFDEIWTGFRYLDGSVQHHTGVTPDLTCLGKALSNGFPLAAVVGKRSIFTAAVHKIHYTPTFKGELYSFRAALAALDIYAKDDVAPRVWEYGTKLQNAVTALAAERGVPLRLAGIPCRMVATFEIADDETRVYARTLLSQELLRRGLLTFRGLLIPSTAHDAKDYERSVDVFREALDTVRDALERRAFVEKLEIPLIR